MLRRECNTQPGIVVKTSPPGFDVTTVMLQWGVNMGTEQHKVMYFTISLMCCIFRTYHYTTNHLMLQVKSTTRHIPIYISLQKNICYFDNCNCYQNCKNSPLWQPAMSKQQTWSTGTAELLQGLGSLLRHQIGAIHNEGHC